uniref:cytochrome P450 n=1 Tax=Saccharomonospora saliphila TaxID=369829 RepID=UPI00035D525A
RIPGRRVAVLLDPDDVGRVLTRTPSPFTPATREKRAALAHFQPHGVLASPMPVRAPRRRFNEAVLESGHDTHTLAPHFARVVREETAALLDGRSTLDWDAFAVAWWRIVRRVVLGDHARDDDVLTDQLAALRSRGNWAFLTRRSTRRRERFHARLAAHLRRAEPGSLAAVVAEHGADTGVHPHGQVPHWLFAFDAAGMATLRTLALLATDREAAVRARAEIEADDRLPFVRACVLEAVRLWPTTPVLLRESTTATSWHGEVLPPGTLFVAFAPYLHRAPELVPFADRFRPAAWLGDAVPEGDVPEGDVPGAVEGYPGLVPFSAGPGQCPGQHLVLLLASATLAELLRGGNYRLRAPHSLRRRDAHDRLPATLDHFSLAFARSPAESGHEARGNSR